MAMKIAKITQDKQQKYLKFVLRLIEFTLKCERKSTKKDEQNEEETDRKIRRPLTSHYRVFHRVFGPQNQEKTVPNGRKVLLIAIFQPAFFCW